MRGYVGKRLIREGIVSIFAFNYIAAYWYLKLHPSSPIFSCFASRGFDLTPTLLFIGCID